MSLYTALADARHRVREPSGGWEMVLRGLEQERGHGALLKHALGVPSLAALLWMRCSSLSPSHTQRARHVQLSCVSSVWINVAFEP